MSERIQLFWESNWDQKHYPVIQMLLKMRKNWAQHLDMVKNEAVSEFIYTRILN